MWWVVVRDIPMFNDNLRTDTRELFAAQSLTFSHSFGITAILVTKLLSEHLPKACVRFGQEISFQNNTTLLRRKRHYELHSRILLHKLNDACFTHETGVGESKEFISTVACVSEFLKFFYAFYSDLHHHLRFCETPCSLFHLVEYFICFNDFKSLE